MTAHNRALAGAFFAYAMPFLFAACSGASEARTPANAQGGRGGPTATPVEIAVAELGRVSRSTTLAGIIEPVRVVGVNAQLAGALGTVRVLEGARVGVGDTLASIIVPELEAQLQASEAALDFARSTVERSEELFKGRIVTAAEVERDRAALAAARSTKDALSARLGFAHVRAPMAGVVTERLVETGDIVSPNQRLFTVADVATLLTRVQVSELEVGALEMGQSVRLTVDAVPGEEFTGRIRRIFPTADSTTRMIPVEVMLTGASTTRLRPGYTARTTFRLQSRDDALLIPVRAVQGGAGSLSVFVVQEGKPSRRVVRTGAEVDGRVEILEGLSAGDTVIVAGATEVRDGRDIRIVQPLAPEEATPGPTPRAAPLRDTATAKGGAAR
ncbi:MAG: efflux RND transporter periplasmic adaptor subunit [Gemmatimonadetes bacterium]|nr:efflux RND transporter periplasmic adaptor subunit [Gemmatimonadota bacterium]MCC6771907.1 efflux RND transporter periplasmic adaptor subunit [Gemmatimonadaceae bacterium]